MSATVQSISSITETTAAAKAAAAASQSSATLGQTDFLTLLIAQLQQQDPLNPQDPSEFASQLAQFSSLEQLTNVNTSLSNLGTNVSDAVTGLQMLMLSSNSTQAVNFIGKDVLYTSDEMQISGGTSSDLRLQASEDLHDVKITLKNSSGTVVRTLDLGSVSKGEHTYSYDSLGDGLTGLANGTYTISIDGLDSTGAAATASPLLSGTVQGIYFENGVTYADIDGERIALSDIYSVRAATAA